MEWVRIVVITYVVAVYFAVFVIYVVIVKYVWEIIFVVFVGEADVIGGVIIFVDVIVMYVIVNVDQEQVDAQVVEDWWKYCCN